MKRTIVITVSAILVISVLLLWLGNSQNSPTVSATVNDFSTFVEMQHSLPGRETVKIESASEDRSREAFDQGIWYNGGSRELDLDVYEPGPWYNGD